MPLITFTVVWGKPFWLNFRESVSSLHLEDCLTLLGGSSDEAAAASTTHLGRTVLCRWVSVMPS